MPESNREAMYSLLLTQALFEVLEAKGLVTRVEVAERRGRLEQEAEVRAFAKMETAETVLIDYGTRFVEALYETLADKGLMTKAEVTAQVQKLRSEFQARPNRTN